MKTKKEYNESNIIRLVMKDLITKRYKPSFRTRVGWFFDGIKDLLMILILCMFNPFFIFVGGLIAIIILLII